VAWRGELDGIFVLLLHFLRQLAKDAVSDSENSGQNSYLVSKLAITVGVHTLLFYYRLLAPKLLLCFAVLQE
jgi:hypothetical protein